MIDLSVNIGSLRLKNPVLMASGCFGWGSEYSKVFDIDALGGIVTKTITLKPREGNKPPRIWETPGGMLNSIGLANPGVETFINEAIPFLEKVRCARVVSIAGETVSEFERLLSIIAPLEPVDAIEINISCPNVEKGGMSFGTDPAVVSRLFASLRVITKKPLWAKLTPNVTDIVEIAKSAVEAGADALVAINTLIGMDIDIMNFTPRLGNITGGLSGPAIKPVALAKVYALHKALPNVPIIGSGGIVSPGDAISHMLAGATAIQVGSGIFANPLLPLEIIENLELYCLNMDFPRAAYITGYLIIPGNK